MVALLRGGAARMRDRACGLRRASSRSQDTLALRAGKDHPSVEEGKEEEFISDLTKK